MMVMTEADVAASSGFEMEVGIEISVDRSAGGGANPVRGLISFILDRYHQTHRRELPELEALARKVEIVHAAHAQCPSGLADFLSETLQELEMHMQKEEQMLFPALLAGGAGCAPFAMRRMRAEHAEHDERLEQLKARTNDFTPPEGACGSWVRLYAGCAKLYDDLRAHIDTENNVLFPMFE
jgi:regulator of cell morphogenesis and NO signaling